MDIISVLKTEASKLQQQLEGLNSAIKALGGRNSSGAGGNGRKSGNGRRKKRHMSAAGRRAISRAQKLRWAKQKA